ncbi:hypothetical protein ANO14919_072280 [Xylariales sp. No.14919]|nr:hypothetical protein ANO14919_072280 [Xylariales sp. No.14919]
MVRSVHTQEADSGCLATLSSCFRTRRKDRSPVVRGLGGQKSHPPNYRVETPRAEAPLPAADALGTTLLESTNTLSTPTLSAENEKSPEKEENDLWHEAFEKIDEATKKQISGDFDRSGDDPVRSLISIVQGHEARLKGKSAKIKVGEREIIWRDYAARVVDGLTVLGDVAVQFAPAPSSIIWSALKVLLKAHVSECESLAAMLGCATQVLPLVRCGAVYEKVYLKDIAEQFDEAATNLREALVNLYVKILQLLFHATHYLDKNVAVRFLHALLYPSESEESIQGLDKAGAQLSTAVQACQSVQSKGNNAEARKLLQSLDEPLRHIDEGVKTILETVSADDRSKMLDTFSTVRFGDQHLRRTRYRIEGTGTWLLRHQKFYEWETSSSSSILWLTGKMGAGKSILTSNVVDRYRVENTSECEPIDEGFAFFYYSKSDQELKGDPIAHILGSFLRQLATVPRYPKDVYTGLIELRRLMEDAKITFDANHCKETLSQLVDLLPRTVIVLDGLDEFESSSDVGDIVQFFIEVVENSERPVKIFISSREDPYIRDELLEAKNNLAHITFFDENQPDIKKFVQKRTQEIGRWWNPEIKQKVETTLCDQANGMFRWVYLQIEQLANINSPEEVLERLKRLPKGLGEAYDELYNANDGWDRIYLQRAVKWVLYSRESLSTERLLSAVQLGQNSDDDDELRLEIASRLNEPALENICRHLIVKDHQGNWEFAHASVEEYFRGKKHKSWISDDSKVEWVKLLLLLLIENFQDLWLPESDEKARALIKYEESDGNPENPAIYLLRSYASKHWVFHVKAIRDEADKCASISQLLKRFMIDPDCPYRSSLGYETWGRYLRLISNTSYDKWALSYNLITTDNPVFGLLDLGLRNTAKQWGEECFELRLAYPNEYGIQYERPLRRVG